MFFKGHFEPVRCLTVQRNQKLDGQNISCQGGIVPACESSMADRKFSGEK